MNRLAVCVVAGLLLAMGDWAAAATVRCPITGKCYNVPSSGGGYVGGGVAPRAPVKGSVVRLVNHEGEVEYFFAETEKEIAKKRDKATQEYEKAKQWWDRVQVALRSQNENLSSERFEPVQPSVDVLSKNVEKKAAAKQISESKDKDWAVYEIAIGEAKVLKVCYANSDAFAKAEAQAEHARLHNQWVRGGMKESEKVPQPKVTKLTDGASRAEAESAMRRQGNGLDAGGTAAAKS